MVRARVRVVPSCSDHGWCPPSFLAMDDTSSPSPRWTALRHFVKLHLHSTLLRIDH
jgi:hypothetical protein